MNYQRQLLKNRKNHDPIKDLLLKISFVVDQMKKDSNKTLNILLLSDQYIYSNLKKNSDSKIEFLETYDTESQLKLMQSIEESSKRFDLVIGIGAQEVLQSKLNTIDYKKVINKLHVISESVMWLFPTADPNNVNSWAINSDYGRDLSELWDFVSEIGTYKIHARNAYAPLVLISDKYLFIGKKILVSNKDIKIIYKSKNNYYCIVVKYKKLIIKISLSQDKEKIKLMYNESIFINKLSVLTKIRLRLPLKIQYFTGSYVSYSKRKYIEGVPLTEIKDIESTDLLLSHFLDLTIKYSENHLFMNDLRPWNIIWDGKKCHFIDFEYSSEFDDDNSRYPQIVYFFAVAHLISKKLDSTFWSPDQVIDFLNTHTSFRSEPDKYYSDMWLGLPNYSRELLKISFNDIEVGFSELIDILGVK
jgi:hypothetical protein